MPDDDVLGLYGMAPLDPGEVMLVDAADLIASSKIGSLILDADEAGLYGMAPVDPAEFSLAGVTVWVASAKIGSLMLDVAVVAWLYPITVGPVAALFVDTGDSIAPTASDMGPVRRRCRGDPAASGYAVSVDRTGTSVGGAFKPAIIATADTKTKAAAALLLSNLC
jgi:hypothetical protein